MTVRITEKPLVSSAVSAYMREIGTTGGANGTGESKRRPRAVTASGGRRRWELAREKDPEMKRRYDMKQRRKRWKDKRERERAAAEAEKAKTSNAGGIER
jgi:hypothetical protein